MSQNQTQTYIPKFSYPSEKVKDEKKYFELMSKSEKGNYLFSRYGFWHGGVHLGESFGNKICSIADGELVAYRINEKYLQNDDEKEKTKGLFSTGFFLVRHKIEYPKDNKLTFFSLYMHTAKKQDYIKEEYFTKTKGTNIFLRRGYESSAYSPAVGNELPSNTKIITDGNWINNRARILYAEGRDINLSQNLTIHNSNVTDTHKKDVPKLEEILSNKKFNEVIVLPTPIKIKAGETLGLMGEYNASKQSDNKVVHLEVFTSNDIKTFVQKAQAQDKNLPQSFNWAKIIDVESKDHISIFDDISNFLLPDKYQTDEIKMNKSYAELFELIDIDHDGKMEVQEIKDAVRNPKIKEITSKYIVKHSSEWDDKINMAEVLGNFFDEHEEKFSDILKLRKHYKNERKRIEKLEFFSKCSSIDGFPKEDKVYHIHPIGLVGAFGVEGFNWMETPIVKLILSKESNGNYGAYNITNRKGKPIYGFTGKQNLPSEHKYDIENMTIDKIQEAQNNRVGEDGLHLFAVGAYQCVPITLNDSIRWLSIKGKNINITITKFNKEFQDILPIYFWESKKIDIGNYFRGKVKVEQAAYSISKEWASAGVPKGFTTESEKISDGTNITYYDSTNNKAHYNGETTIQALKDTKKILDENGGYEMIIQKQISNFKDIK